MSRQFIHASQLNLQSKLGQLNTFKKMKSKGFQQSLWTISSPETKQSLITHKNIADHPPQHFSPTQVTPWKTSNTSVSKPKVVFNGTSNDIALKVFFTRESTSAQLSYPNQYMKLFTFRKERTEPGLDMALSCRKRTNHLQAIWSSPHYNKSSIFHALRYHSYVLMAYLRD